MAVPTPISTISERKSLPFESEAESTAESVVIVLQGVPIRGVLAGYSQASVVETSTPVDTRQKAASDGGSVASGPVYPQVTICLVAHNPGAWFEEALSSLLAQDYPALELVVVDAASDEPVAPRVHTVIPEATVVPLVANQGFAKNANTILEHPGLGSYLLICHDDVALAPDCIRRLVEETLRSNAGIVGPKLLDWDDPNRILHVGLGADKTGLVSDLAEPGEYDQEQHDAVRDVFAVPGAATLVRTDLFRALGGFDEGMLLQGEDLDLCWRAHTLGARVLVNPAATARHREDLTTRVVGVDRDRFARRHRIRSMLSNYGGAHIARVLPQALIASLVNIVIALFQGRLSAVADIATAWTWNLRRLPEIRRRRKALSKVRQVGDNEVRALQTPGFEGVQAWRRARGDRDVDLAVDPSDPAAQAVAAEHRRWFQISAMVWTGVVVVLVFGSRGLIQGGVPVFNEFLSFPDGPRPLMTEWTSTWRGTGVGAEAPPSLLHGLLGFSGIGLFGQVGLLRLLVTVGMLGFGAVGAYRLLQPFRSIPAQLIALIVYVAAPLPYNALHGGSWSGLVAYGVMPWLAKRLAIAAGIAPFGDLDPSKGRRVADVAFVALLAAAASLIQPVVGALVLVLAVGWILGGLATRRVKGSGRLILVTLASVVVAFVLLMPGSLGVVNGSAEWSLFGGTRSLSSSGLGLGELFRLATGPHGDSEVGWALLVLPALSLALAFGERLAWAARSWVVIILSVGLAWMTERAEIDIALADPHVLLAPAALGLAFAAGMASMAVQRDLRRYRFGWRQLGPFVAIVAVVASASAGLGGAIDGRWKVVDDGYESVFASIDAEAPAHGRILWIGNADVLPVGGWRYDDDLTFAITQARTPTVLDHPMGNAGATTEQIRDIFADTLSGASSRLGERLATFGVRFVVVVESNAPAPFSTVSRPVDPFLSQRLTEQLDLVRREARSGATIFENEARLDVVSALPQGSIAARVDGDVLGGGDIALNAVTASRTYRGTVLPSEIYVATPHDTNWSFEVDGEPLPQIRVDWAQAYAVDTAGAGVLAHENTTSLWLASLAQLIGWVALVVVLILARRRP